MLDDSDLSTVGLAALAGAVATALAFSAVASGVGPLAAMDVQNDSDSFPPETDEFGDPVVDYDKIDAQVALESANGSSVEYELVVLGAVEPANESADGTVSCENQRCVIEGTAGDGDRPAYNVSGAVTQVSPDERLVGHVNGTFEGDALTGLGFGAVQVGETPAENATDGNETDGNATASEGNATATDPNVSTSGDLVGNATGNETAAGNETAVDGNATESGD